MKKIMLIMLSVVLSFVAFSPLVNVASADSLNALEMQAVKESADKVAKKYGFDEVVTGDDLPNDVKLLEFDSFEDLEEFLDEQASKPQADIEVNNESKSISDSVQQDVSNSSISRIDDDHFLLFDDDGIFNHPANTVLRVDFAYTTKNMYSNGIWFDSITDIDVNSLSPISTWVNTLNPRAKVSIINGQYATFRIKGYHLLGVAVKGFELGFKAFKDYDETVREKSN
ncbi:hypothetical protein [Aureibacillus halotolerans]|uniref:Uncharacterized protein n=1 Tax=Aureibacillus halotolerans TaxID=1508390 RepID=A0A4R6TUH4_9BACI|nr:hypothetical protein [Aureibacillus halotolerans]TDQ35304.1 hypothetical protein EV213_12291 [Aureibacillus halotolerans]